MKVLVEWRRATPQGWADFVMDLPDFPFDRPMDPNDPERKKIEEYAAKVARQTFSRNYACTPVVTVMESHDRIMPREGSPWWMKHGPAPKGPNEVE